MGSGKDRERVQWIWKWTFSMQQSLVILFLLPSSHFFFPTIMVSLCFVCSGPGGAPEESRARRRAGVQRGSEWGDARGEDLGGRDGSGAEDRASFGWRLCRQLCEWLYIIDKCQPFLAARLVLAQDFLVKKSAIRSSQIYNPYNLVVLFGFSPMMQSPTSVRLPTNSCLPWWSGQRESLISPNCPLMTRSSFCVQVRSSWNPTNLVSLWVKCFWHSFSF